MDIKQKLTELESRITKIERLLNIIIKLQRHDWELIEMLIKERNKNGRIRADTKADKRA